MNEIYVQDMDDSNVADLLAPQYLQRLQAVVSENDGGIIAYAVDDNATKIADALRAATARYDLLVFRDTDGGTDSYFFKNGQPWTEYNEFTFDNGNAAELSGIRASAYDALNNSETPEGIKVTLIEGYTMEQDSSYVEDDSETCTVCGSDVTQYPLYPDEGQKVGYLDSNWRLGFAGHEHTLTEQDVADDDNDNTDALSDDEQGALDELVLEQASQAASNTINSGDQMEYLLSQGWSEKEIRDRLKEMTAN